MMSRHRQLVCAAACAALMLALAWPAASAPEFAMSYEFGAAPIPASGGTVTVPARVGGLFSILSLTAAKSACRSRGGCGTFAVWIGGLPPAARAQFGHMQGTFSCAGSRCALIVAHATGIFAKVHTGAVLSFSAAQATSGEITVAHSSLSDWVTAVARTATALKAAGQLPGVVTVRALVLSAASNGRSSSGQGASVAVQGAGESSSGSTSGSGHQGGSSGSGSKGLSSGGKGSSGGHESSGDGKGSGDGKD